MTWELVSDHEVGFLTERLKVIGGWLVINREYYSSDTSRPVLVPDPDHTWEIEDDN